MIEATEISRGFAFTFHLPLATYHWPLTTGHLPLATYHWPLTTAFFAFYTSRALSASLTDIF